MAGIASFRSIINRHGYKASIVELNEHFNNNIFDKEEYPEGVKRIKIQFPDGFITVVIDYGSDVHVSRLDKEMKIMKNATLHILDEKCGVIYVY
jgi:hypothetical protein